MVLEYSCFLMTSLVQICIGKLKVSVGGGEWA